MKVLILGRLQRVMNNVIEILGDVGIKADGVLTNEDAYNLLESGDYKVIIIGGGIEQPVRDIIRSKTIPKGIEMIEVVVGPYTIERYYRDKIVPRILQLKPM